MRTTTPLRFIIIVLASILASLLFRDWVVERIYIATPSMEPTLPVNSRWWMDKVTFKFRLPRHGEIVVMSSPVSSEKDVVKRVIGIGGDTIEIRNKLVYRNNQKLEEAYVIYKRAQEILVGDNLGPITVPAWHFFVMGDNRDESGDSRDWKDIVTKEPVYFVSFGHIKGRIIGISIENQQ